MIGALNIIPPKKNVAPAGATDDVDASSDFYARPHNQSCEKDRGWDMR